LSNSPINKVLVVLASALIVTIILASLLAWINFNQQNQIETLQNQESNLQNEITQLQNQIETQQEQQNNLQTIINNQDNFIENLSDYFEINQNSATLKGDINNLEDYIYQSINQAEIINVTTSGLSGYHALIVQSWANAIIKNTGKTILKDLTVKTYTSRFKSLADTIEIESIEPGESTSIKGSYLFSLSVYPTVIIEIWINGVIIESGSYYFE
jgi:hypothetical protein